MVMSLSRMGLKMKPMKHRFLQIIKFLKWCFSIKRKISSMTVYQLRDLFPKSSIKNKLNNQLSKLMILNLAENLARVSLVRFFWHNTKVADLFVL
jgi:hypothetical protein